MGLKNEFHQTLDRNIPANCGEMNTDSHSIQGTGSSQFLPIQDALASRNRMGRSAQYLQRVCNGFAAPQPNVVFGYQHGLKGKG